MHMLAWVALALACLHARTTVFFLLPALGLLVVNYAILTYQGFRTCTVMSAEVLPGGATRVKILSPSFASALEQKARPGPRDPAPALACASSHPDRTHNGPAVTSSQLSFHSRNLRPSTSPGRRWHRSVWVYCGQGARGELACQRTPLLHLRTFRQRRIHSQRRVREPRSGQRVHPRPQHGAGHMDGPAHEACRGEGLGDARYVAGALREPRCEAPKLPGLCPPRVLRSVLAFHLSLTMQRLTTTLSLSAVRHRLRPLTPRAQAIVCVAGGVGFTPMAPLLEIACDAARRQKLLPHLRRAASPAPLHWASRAATAGALRGAGPRPRPGAHSGGSLPRSRSRPRPQAAGGRVGGARTGGPQLVRRAAAARGRVLRPGNAPPPSRAARPA